MWISDVSQWAASLMEVFSVSTEEGCKSLASLLLHRKAVFNHSGLDLYLACFKKTKTKKTSKGSFVASQEDGRSGKREDFLRLHKASRASEQLIKVAPVPPSYFTTNSRGLRGCTGWLPWMRDKSHPTPEAVLSGRGDPTPGGWKRGALSEGTSRGGRDPSGKLRACVMSSFAIPPCSSHLQLLQLLAQSLTGRVE